MSPEMKAVYTEALKMEARDMIAYCRDIPEPQAIVHRHIDDLARLTAEGPSAEELAALADANATGRRNHARRIIRDYIERQLHQEGV